MPYRSAVFQGQDSGGDAQGPQLPAIHYDRPGAEVMDQVTDQVTDQAHNKARLATVWLGGCSGCHMSFLDLDERLIDLAGIADVCYSPIADVKEFPEHVDITLVEGAVANEDHLRDIRLIRQRTRILIAFGDCAVTGNVTALRNLFSVDDVLNRAYLENSTIVNGVPTRRGDGIVPQLLDRVLRIQDTV